MELKLKYTVDQELSTKLGMLMGMSLRRKNVNA